MKYIEENQIDQNRTIILGTDESGTPLPNRTVILGTDESGAPLPNRTVILGTDESGAPLQNRTIILGTDWWTDCDDVAALRILCRAAKRGLWSLAGIICNAAMPDSAASLNAFLTSEGYGDLPLGIDRDATDYGGAPPYQRLLSALPHTVPSNDALPDGVELYRELLTKAPDKVELLEIGYPQVLAALCADETGRALVAKKVSCLWMMAGNWEKDGHGRENNFARAPRSRKAAATLLRDFPCPIVFLGWEVGASVISGTPETIPDESDPLRIAFAAHGSQNGRSSWDPMLVLLALSGDPQDPFDAANLAKAGYTLRRGKAAVDSETGENDFTYAADGKHGYVVKTMPDTWYEKELAQFLQ